MLIFIGVVFAMLYLYSFVESAATMKNKTNYGKLRQGYEDTVKQYNLAQLAKKLKNRNKGGEE